MLACVLFMAVFTSLLTSKVTAGELAQAKAINTLADVRGTLCMTTAYPRLTLFVRSALVGRNDVRVVEDEVWACAERVLDGRAVAYISDRALLLWYSATYSGAGAGDLYVSPSLSVNPYAFGFANGSALRQALNPSLIATLVDPAWTPSVAALLSHYAPALGSHDGTTLNDDATSVSARAVSEVNRALLGCTIALMGVTSLYSLFARACHRALGCVHSPRITKFLSVHHVRAMQLERQISSERARRTSQGSQHGGGGSPPKAAVPVPTEDALADASEALRKALACLEQLRGEAP
jgi:hypothetical protein